MASTVPMINPLTKPKYGLLTPISPINGGKYWSCECDCGNITKASRWHLEHDARRSCGCRKQELAAEIVCTKCNKPKSRSEFYIRKNGNLSQRQCKPCCVRIMIIKGRILRYLVLKHYSNGKPKCECCGEIRLEFLGIDHIDGGGNQHRKTANINNLYKWLRKHKHPNGFRVLCHNCNHALGSYGHCPHHTESLVIEEMFEEMTGVKQLTFDFYS